MKHARKAILATILATAGALGAAMLDGNLTTTETIASIGVGLVTGAGTWRIPNTPPGTHRAN